MTEHRAQNTEHRTQSTEHRIEVKTLKKTKKELLMELSEKDEKIEEYLNLAKTIKADFENYKKRIEEEKRQLKNIYQMEVFLEFLPIFDNIERALKEETKDIKDGVLLIKKEFENILLKKGFKRIQTIGCEFSPNLHTAILSIPTKEKRGGIILEEVQSGWVCGDFCIRPASVIVSKEWEEEALEKRE